MNALMYPLATEKAINMIQKDNVITYIVDMRSTKSEIKKEFEATFKAKVIGISTARHIKNMKKAYILLSPEFKASDIALKLKLI